MKTIATFSGGLYARLVLGLIRPALMAREGEIATEKDRARETAIRIATEHGERLREAVANPDSAISSALTRGYGSACRGRLSPG